MSTTIEKVLSINGFRTMTTWLCDQIKQLFATEAQTLRASIYPTVGMCYVGSETNVQAIAQFGIEGKTYFLGDTSTENTTMQRPAGAMYYMENGTQVFVRNDTADYIETTPLNGSMIEVTYSSEMTYLGGM